MGVPLLDVFNGSMAEAPWTAGLEEGLRRSHQGLQTEADSPKPPGVC